MLSTQKAATTIENVAWDVLDIFHVLSLVLNTELLSVPSSFIWVTLGKWSEQLSFNERVGGLIPPIQSHVEVFLSKALTPNASDVCPISVPM